MRKVIQNIKNHTSRETAMFLRGARKQQGYTQESLGRKIGVPQNTISNIEKGESDIKIKDVLLYCVACSVNFDDVVKAIFNRDDGEQE